MSGKFGTLYRVFDAIKLSFMVVKTVDISLCFTQSLDQSSTFPCWNLSRALNLSSPSLHRGLLHVFLFSLCLCHRLFTECFCSHFPNAVFSLTRFTVTHSPPSLLLNMSPHIRQCRFVLSGWPNCHYVCIWPKVNNIPCVWLSQASCRVGIALSRYRPTSSWHGLSLSVSLTLRYATTLERNNVLVRLQRKPAPVKCRLERKLAPQASLDSSD